MVYPLTMPAETTYRIRTDIVYRDGEDRCRLDVYAPVEEPPPATIVWFHGGGLNSGERHVPEGLKGQGYAVVAAGYRLSPQVRAPAYMDDAAAAVAWTFAHVAEWGGRADRIVVAGASAGAYLASLVVLDRSWLAPHGIAADAVFGLIALTGQMITHFTVRAERGVDALCAQADAWAPICHVRADAPPVFLATGDRELELFGRYEENAFFLRMLRLTGHVRSELIELPGIDHGGVEMAAMPHACRFLRELLSPANRQATGPFT